MPGFPILMYHAIVPEVATSDERKRLLAGDALLGQPGAWRYALARPVFERQMRSLARRGMRTPPQWPAPDALPEEGEAWITFDDGHHSNSEIALPILQACGLRAAFFITTDWIGRPECMNAEQLRELRRAGMLLGTHGRSHRFFSSMTVEDLKAELTGSRERLEMILGEPVTALSLPGGRSHPGLPALAREAGYAHVFTSTPALAGRGADPLAWPRIPLTNDLSDSFSERLVRGEPAAVARLAHSIRLRGWVRGLLGDRLLSRLRGRY